MHPSRSSISTRLSRRLALGAASLLAAACAGPVRLGAAAGGHRRRARRGGPAEHRPDPGRRSDAGPIQLSGPCRTRCGCLRGTARRSATTSPPPRSAVLPEHRLITGQYAHNDGVTSNGVGYPGLVDKGNVLPVWLQQAGYLTFHVGKFMNGYQNFAHPPSTVPPGWDQWYSYLGGHQVLRLRPVRERDGRPSRREPPGQRHPRRDPEGGSADSRLGVQGNPDLPPARRARASRSRPEGSLRQMRRTCRSRSPRTRVRSRTHRLPRPPSFNERDMRDKPPFLSSAPRLDRGGTNRVRRRWRCALAATKGVDRGVARVYDAIKNAGLLGRTVFIFISDNGQFYGEHRIAKGKVFPVPGGAAPAARDQRAAAISGRRPPRAKRAQAGRQHRSRADDPQLRPCATVPAQRALPDDGRTLAEAAAETIRKAGLAHRGLLTEYKALDPGKYATCQFAGILTRDTMYVEHSRVADPATGQCVPSDQVERYNLKRDPYELHNLCFGGKPGELPGQRLPDRSRVAAQPAPRLRRNSRARPAGGRTTVLRVGATGGADPGPLLPCRCRRSPPASQARSQAAKPS